MQNLRNYTNHTKITLNRPNKELIKNRVFNKNQEKYQQ